MSYVVADQIAELQAWVGFHEGRNNSNPFSLWHGYGTSYLPWCDSFAQYCAVEKGGFRWDSPYAQFGYKGSGYVPTTARDAQHMGIWRSKNTRARPGWQVHFDWNGDGEQDHDETVIADDGTNLVTIGGNTSNAVLYRKRDRRYVAGFVALDESGQLVQLPPPPPKVRPMFDPALELRATLDNPDGGLWLGFEHGRVDFYPANYPTAPRVTGGMLSDADRQHFGTRTLARLKHRTYQKDGATKQGYTIVASDGATYVPEAQH